MSAKEEHVHPYLGLPDVCVYVFASPFNMCLCPNVCKCWWAMLHAVFGQAMASSTPMLLRLFAHLCRGTKRTDRLVPVFFPRSFCRFVHCVGYNMAHTPVR